MRKVLFLCYCFIFVSGGVRAQSVGLVLSGGGAKGMTHIGVIKALEEHNIPIDYVAGTSMGAIVGGLYAMGLSPDEMIELLKSDDFKYWSTGEIPPENIFYYRNSDPNPGFADFRFKFNFGDTLHIVPNLLPVNIISPIPMNYAFLTLFARATAASKGNFDKLFVPFRCVASDIYNKEPVNLKSGDLGDAIRASMTFPFVFKPISINDHLLFDGGIFNNFPVDVMKGDFNPDIIIGSVVAHNPKKPDINNLMPQIENMIMARTDYSLPEEDGVLLNFELSEVNTFDFSKVDELVKLGYDATIERMDELKARIKSETFGDDLDRRRYEFRRQFPKLAFQSVTVEGVEPSQEQYVKHAIQEEDGAIFDIDDFKNSYYNLVSDEKIAEILPHAKYDEATGYFDLHLKVRIEEDFKLTIGGNVSSSTSNQAYLGITYRHLGEYSHSAYINAQFGRIYNGLLIGTRIDLPSKRNMYYKGTLVLHKFDFFEGNRLFYEDNRTAYFTQTETYLNFNIGFPLTMKARMELGLGFGRLTDYYVQDRDLITPTSKDDESRYTLGSVFAKIQNYTLNTSMYPTLGYFYRVDAQLVGGREDFTSAYYPNDSEKGHFDLWVQVKGIYDRYYPLSDKFTLGAYGEFVFSSRKLLQNYTATIIQAPNFSPTPHSISAFNEAYCANRFFALGIKPIYHIIPQLHVRGEAYWFIPVRAINRRADNTADYARAFSVSQGIFEAALVYNFKIASISLYGNHYTSAASKWNFGLNIGFLLFNDRFVK
ncbi:MAG: patatin-like phospholipase family protein [Prevotellaceae bacterium]|nr:patatin-like phospholipase family protein [Prevotellaceae bacterium]